MTDQTEKPKLGARPPLGIKRTVETGKVKQSFSHGRSNTVVVEVKKRRILGRPGEAVEQPKTPPQAEAPKPAAAPAKPAEPARAPKPSQADEITRRREMQERYIRALEETYQGTNISRLYLSPDEIKGVARIGEVAQALFA